MKAIPLRDVAGVRSVDVIRAVLEQPGGQPISVAALRARCRVLDALERASGPALELEDADHETLVVALNGFGFGMASKALLQVVDDILAATAP